MKKILNKLFLLFTLITFISSIIYSVEALDKIMFLSSNEIEKSKDISLTLNLKNIEYNESVVKLLSNINIEQAESSNELENEVLENNELSFEYNKNTSNIDNINFNIKIPENSKIGDIITFKLIVQDKENEENIVEENEIITVVADKIVENENNNQSNQNQTGTSKISNVSNNVQTVKVVSTQSIPSGNTNVVTYNGSSNNYLKSLSVSNYELNTTFKKETTTYFITVDNDVTSIKVNAKAESSSSKVNVSGNTDLKVGINKVLIVVTSENGTNKNYRIFVTRNS